MLAKFGGFLYHRRIVVLCITVAVTIGATIFSQGLFGVLSNAGVGVDNSGSLQATQLLQSKLGDSGLDVILLLRSDRLSATDPVFMQGATSLFSELSKRPEVASLISYYSTRSPDFISRDRHETFAALRLKGHDSTTKQNEYTSLKPELSSQTLQVKVGGTIPATEATVEQATSDLQRAESVTLPILLLLLLVVFGGLVAAGLPLFIGIIAILLTFAVLYGISIVTDVSVYAINVVIMLGLGLAIDYSLFILSRFREELSYNEENVLAALEQTMATAGRTVIFSALTVSTSLLSLLLFPVNLMRSMGLGAIVAILMAMLVSLTFLPVLLALLGRRVNALSLSRFFRSRFSIGTDTNVREQQGVWYHLSEIIMRRPIPVATILIVILLILVIPFFHIKLETTDLRHLPADNEARIVGERLSQDFARQGKAQLIIAVKTPGNALSPENLASLDSYVKSIQAIPGVIHVQSLVTISPTLNLSAYQRIYPHPDFSPQMATIAASMANDDVSKVTVAIGPADHSSDAITLVNQIRAIQAPGDLTALVDGVTPKQIDLLDGIYATLPGAFLVIFASVFVLLFLMTGSLVMPIKAIILNMLSLSATFGGLVWIFQDGHLKDLLHFQPVGNIDATQPILIFALAFGLSMDYEVFVLSRIKERFDETGNNRLAVSSGIQSTGWLVTSAALLMAVVLGGFGLAHSISVQEVGIGLPIAVIMDATLIRMLLLSATMRLLGTFNWWAPAPLRRLWQYIGLKEADAMPALAFYAQGNMVPVASGMSNKLVTDKQYSTNAYSEPVGSSLLHPVHGGNVALQYTNHVISTRTANGEEIMGPDMLLWCYPERHILNGSLLTVKSNQFCVLREHDKILNVYEAGQHRVQTSEDPSFGSGQLTFNGEPIVPEHEALYINRSQLGSQISDVVLSREMNEVHYYVDYALYIATREDAVRLVLPMPYPLQQDQGLCITDINAYVEPVIEQILNRLVQTMPLRHEESDRERYMQYLSQLVRERLQSLLSPYGMTVDEVKVQVVSSNEPTSSPLSLKDFGLSRLEAVRGYEIINNHSNNHPFEERQEEVEQNVYTTWQNRLTHYTDEIAALQSELERTRADFSLRMDTHSTRLQRLSRVISSELPTSVPTLDSDGAGPHDLGAATARS